MLVRVGSPCRAGQTIRFGYGNATIERQLDQSGGLELTLDLFAGTSSPIEIVFADGASRELPARANDLDKVDKVALIWRSTVDLDLHVFEYGAGFGQPGHVWSQAPSSALAAREQATSAKRGRAYREDPLLQIVSRHAINGRATAWVGRRSDIGIGEALPKRTTRSGRWPLIPSSVASSVRTAETSTA